MNDPDGRLADYIAMATLCRRLASALQTTSPERLDEVLAHAREEAQNTLKVKVSSSASESALLYAAARSELTFVQAILRWVRPCFPERAQAGKGARQAA